MESAMQDISDIPFGMTALPVQETREHRRMRRAFHANVAVLCKWAVDTGMTSSRCRCKLVECGNPQSPHCRDAAAMPTRFKIIRCTPFHCKFHGYSESDLAWLDTDDPCADQARDPRPTSMRSEPSAPMTVWCERFMIGTTPAYCQQCIAIRNGGDPDAAARWLQRLADRRNGMACASRIKTDDRRAQVCCGQTEKLVAVYRCAVRDREVNSEDCRNCETRTPPSAPGPAGGWPC